MCVYVCSSTLASVDIYQQYLLLFVRYKKSKIDGHKSVTKKPWSSEEMSAMESYFKMNIKSHVVPGKSMVEDAQK